MRTAVLVILAATVVGVVSLSAYEAVVPPFTDVQIRASIADTWQGSALVTTLLLSLVVGVVPAAIVLGLGSAIPLQRRLGVLTAVLAVVGGCGVLANHIALTNRVTLLTGQSFGGFYGLP